MGQRLVVSLIQGEETIAAIYYHWSAYFQSTIYELRDLGKDIRKAREEKKDILLGVLEGLEKRGGGLGVNPRNEKEAEKRFPGRQNKKDISRNVGLLYLGKEEIQETLDMAEGTARIYLDTDEISNDVSRSEYIPWELGKDYVELMDVRFYVDPYDMTMDECFELADYLETMTEQFLTENNREGEQ